MKTFKAFIATAVVTLSASMSMAAMYQNPQQLDACIGSLISRYVGDPSAVDAQTYAKFQRSCNSGLREDGLGYAGCMITLKDIAGLPIASNQFVGNQKAITGAEVCAAGTDSQFLNCVSHQAQSGVAGEQAVRNCSSVNRFWKAQNQLTNGASHVQTMSNEEIAEESINEYARRGYISPATQSRPQPHTEQVPSYPQTGNTMSDLPQVE